MRCVVRVCEVHPELLPTKSMHYPLMDSSEFYQVSPAKETVDSRLGEGQRDNRPQVVKRWRTIHIFLGSTTLSITQRVG